jgi:hypothetical protein
MPVDSRGHRRRCRADEPDIRERAVERVEHPHEIVAAESGPVGRVERGLQALLDLPQQLLAHQGGVERQDVGAFAGDCRDEAVGRQLGIGTVVVMML